MIKYNWICSNRKTMAIQIQVDGKVIVRTPWNVSKDQVEAFLEKKKKWIENKQKERSERPWNHSTFSEEEKEEGIQRALKVIPQRVKYYAQLMNVTYGKITIKEQKTRWGSCSSKGNLNFNWKLVLMPKEILDYVVVHELAHRREMSHSEKFWHHVEGVFPDYQMRRKELREWERTYM